MAFEKGISDQKLMINLSPLAISIMDEDMITFNEQKPASYLNHVFEVFHADAKASIEISLSHYIDQLHETLAHAGLPLNIADKTISILAQEHNNELQSISHNYPKGKSIRFYVRNDLVSYLMETDTTDEQGNHCKEDIHYASVRDYFKAIIEEYSRKPYAERERIYLKEKYDTIETAIKNKHAVEIELSNGNSYRIRAYKIDSDPQNIYHYLLGFSEPAKVDWKDEPQIFSYRISNIVRIKELKSVSGHLTDAKRQEISKSIKQHGVQFLNGDLIEAHVKLTDVGIRKYERMFHLRPVLREKIEPNIYIFHCTRDQIEFYFFKFGWDALILEPADLAEKFKRMYVSAANSYSQFCLETKGVVEDE